MSERSWLLANRAFFAVYVASVVSNVGTFLQDVGEAAVMLALGGSALQVALVTTTTWMPSVFVVLFSGVLADRMDRRIIICAAQLWNAAASLLLAFLTWRGLVTPVSLLLVTTALGVGNAVAGPAWWTFVAGLVPARHMPEAIALQSTSWNIARAVGPALGGFLVAAAGAPVAFLLNAVSFFGVVVMVARAPAEPVPAAPPGVFRAIGEGARVFFGTRDLRVLTFTTSAFALAASPVLSLLPALVAKELGEPSARFGFVLACFGGGAVLGAIAMSRLRPVVAPERLAPLCMGVHGLAALALSEARSLPVACLAVVPAGATWLSLLSTENALLQGLSPPATRARVKSIDTLMFLGLYALGGMLAGVVANHTGVRPVLFASFASVAAVTVVVAMFARWPAYPGTREA